jgi:hypothetical protein
MRQSNVITVSRPQCRTEPIGIPETWDVSFPRNENLRSEIFHAGVTRCYGIVVYRFSETEARFVLRGDLLSGEDLVACLAAGEALARQLKCCELVTHEKLRPDWFDTAVLLKDGGFRPLDESWIFECPFALFAERLNRIMQVLVRNSAVPTDARVTDLTEGFALARTLLEEARLMDGFDFDHRLMSGVAKPISSVYSQLVWIGETLAGVILVAPACDDGTYEIPIRYIIPAYRQTWVNALLIHSCVKRGELLGAATVRFNANSKTHHETIRLAEQAGCVRIASSHRYGKSLS